MNNTHRRTRTALIAAIAATAMAFAAVNASVASAASWNTPGQTKVSGSLTFTQGSKAPVTCPIPLHNGPTAQNVGSTARFNGQHLMNCPGAGVLLRYAATNWGTTQLHNWISQIPLTSPFPGVVWYQDQFTAFPFTSAAAGNPAKITLNNQMISATQYSGSSTPIYATGTINITTSTGGPLVLNP